MAEENKEKSYTFYIVRHSRQEQSDKEPVCKVVLKTDPVNPFQAQLIIKGNHERLFQDYPLQEDITVSLKKAQQRLG